MKYPYKKLVLPNELKTQINGKLEAGTLAKITIGGYLWTGAARSFNAMNKKAVADGIKLINIGDYRSYQGQLSMFKDRYDVIDGGRVPQITRTFKNKTWYLKKGKSPSAAPDPTGKKGSNHGWGLAIDLNVTDNDVAEWLCVNAPVFGFYLQGDDPKSGEFELWHWQYVLGDVVPKVLQV